MGTCAYRYVKLLPYYPHHVADLTLFCSLPQVRAGLAQLGFTSLDELIGRADLLRQRDVTLAKTANLDLTFLTTFAGQGQQGGGGLSVGGQQEY